jgi:hypothetical protein
MVAAHGGAIEASQRGQRGGDVDELEESDNVIHVGCKGFVWYAGASLVIGVSVSYEACPMAATSLRAG